MNSIKFAMSKDRIILGAGVTNQELVAALWQARKRTGSHAPAVGI
jgi:hypothetical protein